MKPNSLYILKPSLHHRHLPVSITVKTPTSHTITMTTITTYATTTTITATYAMTICKITTSNTTSLLSAPHHPVQSYRLQHHHYHASITGITTTITVNYQHHQNIYHCHLHFTGKETDSELKYLC